jgi:thioredoxin 1
MENLEPPQFENLSSMGEKALVLFYADWCPFCQIFILIFQSAAAKSKPTVGYKTYGAKLNADSNPLWDKFSINAVPTVIAFERGRLISRRDGKMGVGLDKSDLDSILDELGWR